MTLGCFVGPPASRCQLDRATRDTFARRALTPPLQQPWIRKECVSCRVKLVQVTSVLWGRCAKSSQARLHLALQGPTRTRLVPPTACLVQQVTFASLVLRRMMRLCALLDITVHHRHRRSTHSHAQAVHSMHWNSRWTCWRALRAPRVRSVPEWVVSNPMGCALLAGVVLAATLKPLQLDKSALLERTVLKAHLCQRRATLGRSAVKI